MESFRYRPLQQSCHRFRFLLGWQRLSRLHICCCMAVRLTSMQIKTDSEALRTEQYSSCPGPLEICWQSYSELY